MPPPRVTPYTGEIENPTGAAPYSGDIEPLEKEPSYASRVWEGAKPGATAAIVGTGAGASAYLARGLLRRMFPGMMPTASALKRLDAAIKTGDSSSGLKPMFSSYLREVSSTGKPLTFADFIAQQPGHATANAALKEMIQHSGNVPEIESRLAERSAGAKGRVLDDIATALGVPKQSVVMGRDALIETRKARAQPLYDQAFADDQPIRDTRFFRLFEAPAARKALGEAVTNAENRLQPIDVRSAANPTRKDWWKRASTEDIPEGLFLDEESPGGLRKYIAPNLRNADAIQKALRQQMESAMKVDPVTGYTKHTEASRALNDLHKKFMGVMYDAAPTDVYRQARQAYAGDSALLEAHKAGAELLSMTPDEARKAVKGMTPDQREALSSGFYGSLQDMNHQKFLRELVARPERYPERRELLSTVFRDPQRLDQFMANLRGEEGMADSAATYGNIPPSKDPGPRLPWLRVTEPMTGGLPYARATEGLNHLFGWPSTRASRAGTDIAFREPQLMPRSSSHPDWGTVNRMPLSWPEEARAGARWTGAGGYGGLGLYGLSQMPGWSGEDMQQ